MTYSTKIIRNNRITIASEVFFRIIESENLPSVFKQIDV